jgi:hypothetical protein
MYVCGLLQSNWLISPSITMTVSVSKMIGLWWALADKTVSNRQHATVDPVFGVFFRIIDIRSPGHVHFRMQDKHKSRLANVT